MGLCLEPYGGPRGGADSYERGTPVPGEEFNTFFQAYPNRLKLCIVSGSNDLHRVCPELAKRNSSSRSYTIKTRIVPENSFYHLEVITLNPEVIVTPDDDFMRTSSMIKHSGSVKINSRMDHISHCKTASG